MKFLKNLASSFFCISLLGTIVNAQSLPDSILKTLKPSHPRLLVNSLADFEDIKKRSEKDEFLRLSVKNLIRNADSLLTAPILSYEFLDHLRMEIRKVTYHSYCLSMAYRLTGEKKYADRLWLDLEAVSKFPDWNPRHFLDCGWVTQAVAISYDWLYDVWTPTQKRILKQQILSKGLLEGLVYYDKRLNPNVFDWTAVEHNWNLICNGNMMIGALSIGDEEPKVSEAVLKSALTGIPKALRQFGPDGAWNEGPGYWSYLMRATIPTLSSLKTALGTDYGLTEIEGFSKAGQFFIALGGAGRKSYNYADAKPVITRSPELFWFATRFNQPKLAEVQRIHSMESLKKGPHLQNPLELLWYRPINNTKSSSFPLDSYFRHAEVATLRSSWDDNAWFVGFKAGDNTVNHGHLDLGSYVLDNQGIRWIFDLGPEDYNVPGYFGATNVAKGGIRWSYYRTRAEGNNTLVINPAKAEDQEIEANSKFERFESKPGKSFGIMDITAAYRTKVSSAKRGIALLNQNKVLIQDEIKAQNNIDLYWFSHTEANITISADGKKAFLKQGRKTIVARLTSPANAIFEVMDAQPLPTSPNPPEIYKNVGVKKLAVHLTAVKDVTIAIEYTASDTNKKSAITPLSKW